LPFGCRNNSTLTLFAILDADEVLVDDIGKKSLYWSIFAAENDGMPLLGVPQPLRLEARKLLPV
jgi:hypothetical protein